MGRPIRRAGDRVYGFAAEPYPAGAPTPPTVAALVGGGDRFQGSRRLDGVDEEVVDRGGVREDLGELVGDLLELRGRAKNLLRVYRERLEHHLGQHDRVLRVRPVRVE